MTLSDLIQTTHRFIGTDRKKYEFIQWLPTLLMRDPISDDEEKDTDKEIYYPFGQKNPNNAFKTKLKQNLNGFLS